MADTPLSVHSLDQLCQCLGVGRAALDALAASMPRQFRKYEHRSPKSGKTRLIYDPCPRLREVQAPLVRLLGQIPISDAAHGWRRGRSPATNAAPHVGKAVVMRLDLEDFFPSCRFERVHDLFLRLGCSAEVAGVLTRVTTADYHLPQGFLTSPAIANLLLATPDRRLAGLARQRRADYTRYGDDLAFSGPASMLRMTPLARKIVGEAGHRVNPEKFAQGGVRHAHERQEICAITVNEKVNLRRPDLRRYRDIIRNCVESGPASELGQNETLLHMRRRVQGYVHYVQGINREAARQLQGEFDRIDWMLISAED